MTFHDPYELGEHLHRLAKLALDSGEVSSVEKALELFSNYSIHIHAGTSVGKSPAQQAALLTAVNSARRALLGSITISGLGDAPLLVPIAKASSFAEAISSLGGQVTERPIQASCAVQIGNGGSCLEKGIRSAAKGWVAMCGPISDEAIIDDPDAFVLAGVAAGALAVAECFQQMRGNNPAAGRRQVGLSLWRPDMDWSSEGAYGVMPCVLPSGAWLIGLGNLGQAYLWSLGMLPYAVPKNVKLVLQDFDQIAPSNDSTSLLTNPALVGRHKTRVLAEWAEDRGFATTLVERRFGDNLRITAEDPPVALSGVDNALSRAALEEVGFARVFEAGLGNGISDFLALRLHSFPSKRRARDIWSGAPAAPSNLLAKPAYQAMEAAGADKCGLTQLAGRTVGAPFVGALAGAMVIGELVKLANGGPNMALVDLHLRSPAQIHAFPQSADFSYNPGVTEVA
ncbi:MAG: thiamine biosynthesis protein ThiF [Novosphingobium sp.]|nr:hypothetical protein [Novosphingobium sp.]MCP5401950.1 thiamine biosynthesis protein ThiF [Novosphingobium sp.]